MWIYLHKLNKKTSYFFSLLNIKLDQIFPALGQLKSPELFLIQLFAYIWSVSY